MFSKIRTWGDVKRERKTESNENESGAKMMNNLLGKNQNIDGLPSISSTFYPCEILALKITKPNVN
jgi:hypothetical protein